MTVTRPFRTLAAPLVVLVVLVGFAACGIDEGEVSTVATTTAGGDAGSGSTSTTDPGAPAISLPDIPSDVTEPDSTVPDPTQPDSLPAGEATPGGFTPENIRDALQAEANLTEQQATCVSIGVFATFDDATIDELFTAPDTASLDPDVADQFEEIVTTCVQGG
jgi:hypothetical protein